MNSPELHLNGQYELLLNLPITTALSATATTPIIYLEGIRYLVVQANFTYGSGGTTADAYIQTSIDNGATWVDIMDFHFTTSSGIKVSAVNAYIAPASQAFTPSDGSLSANTIIQGVLGSQLRVKYVTTGTYATSTTLRVDAVLKG